MVDAEDHGKIIASDKGKLVVFKPLWNYYKGTHTRIWRHGKDLQLPKRWSEITRLVLLRTTEEPPS
jgi:ABC-type uncharacterized transport system YnjBCD substrate-binding protein